MATDPHLSDAQIAAIREWRAKGAARELLGNAYISAVRHIEALLDHSEALRSDLQQASVELRDARIFLHGAEQAHRADAERLVQAEAALQALDLDYGKLLKEANQREAERNASTEAIEDWREWARAVYPASFARDADETYRLCIAALVEGNAERAAAQAERIAQLETVLKDVLNAARSRYPAKVIQSMAESSL